MTQINLNDIAKSLLEVAQEKHSHVQPPQLKEVKKIIHDVRTLLLPEYFMVGDDIAAVIEYCLSLPAHVNLNDIEIMPTQQANAYYTHRK